MFYGASSNGTEPWKKTSDPDGWLKEIGADSFAEEVYVGYADDCSLCFAVKGTIKTAWNGEMVEITSLEIDPETLAKFEQFMAEHNLLEGKPGWYLSSNWG